MSKDHEERLKKIEKVIFAGKEDHFLLAWGRLMTYAAQSRWMMVLVVVSLLASIGGNVAFAYRWNKRDTYIFKQMPDGSMVPLATAEAFAAASIERKPEEITGFAKRWVYDAYTYNPLNVKDTVNFALRYVDASAQAEVKAELRLEERAAHRDAGISVSIIDAPERGKAPAVSIVRMEPLEVSVVFQRVAVNSIGESNELGPLVCNLQLKQVPRSTGNPSGLLISNFNVTKS